MPRAAGLSRCERDASLVGAKPAIMKNPNPDETMELQEVDIADVDLSAEPPRSPSRMAAPPPLPPMAAMVPPQAPVAPLSPSRGPMFYVGILAAVLVVSIAGGTAVALSRRAAPQPPVAQAPTASPQAPKVITIGVVDMKDDPDGAP